MDGSDKETLERRVPKVKFKRIRQRPRTKGFRLFLKNEIEKALCAKPSIVGHLFEAGDDGILSARFTEVIAVLGLNTEKLHSLSTIAIKSISNISSLFRIDGSSYDDLRIYRKLADAKQDSTVVYVDNLPFNCRVLYILQRASMFGTIVSLRVRFVGEKKERTCYTFLTHVAPSVSTAQDLLLSEHRVESAFIQFVEAAAAEKFCRVYKHNLPGQSGSPSKRRKRSFTRKRKSLQRALAHSALDSVQTEIFLKTELKSGGHATVAGQKKPRNAEVFAGAAEGVAGPCGQDSSGHSGSSRKRRHHTGSLPGDPKKACFDHCTPLGDALPSQNMKMHREQANNQKSNFSLSLPSEEQSFDKAAPNIIKESDYELLNSTITTVIEELSVGSMQRSAAVSKEVVAVKSDGTGISSGSKKEASACDGVLQASVQVSQECQCISTVEQEPPTSSTVAGESKGDGSATNAKEATDVSEAFLIPETQYVTALHRPTGLSVEKTINRKVEIHSSHVVCSLRRRKKGKRMRRRRKRCTARTKSRISHVTRYFCRMQVMPLVTFRKLREEYLALKKKHMAGLKKELKNKKVVLAIPGKTRRERTRIRGRRKLVARAVASREQCEEQMT